MNVRRITRSVAVFVLSVLSVQTSAAQQTGSVQISSLNPNGELVPFIDVIIEGNGIKRVLETVGVGEEYENGGLVELPVGTYQITSRNGNYYPFRRAPFRVVAGTAVRINVCPVLQVLMQALVFDPRRGMHDEYQFAPPPKYSSFKVPNVSGQPLDLLIRYDTKSSRRGMIEYTGNRIIGGAMASHDALTIYARRFRYNQQRLLLVAEGGVILEDGKSRTHLNKVTVSFKNGATEILRQ